jgi:hypothetical protein
VWQSEKYFSKVAATAGAAAATADGAAAIAAGVARGATGVSDLAGTDDAATRPVARSGVLCAVITEASAHRRSAQNPSRFIHTPRVGRVSQC